MNDEQFQSEPRPAETSTQPQAQAGALDLAGAVPVVHEQPVSDQAVPEPAVQSAPAPLEALDPDAEQLTLVGHTGPALNQYCIFRAGRERFCFSVLDVEEVVEWPRITRVPLAPSFLMGVFNLRGSIVPVIDIAFTEGRRADLAPKHVVVASLPADGDRDIVRVGIAADEVMGTYSTAEPLSLAEAPLEVPHCCGVLRLDDKMALALDLKKLAETFRVPVI
jgi:purine-binding chemotaxis protein CheW